MAHSSFAMKLRSHEILSDPSTKVHSTSRLKQLFQRKHLLKKKSATSSVPTASHLRHAIPHYVRKSILRFLVEQPSPSRNVRPPVMGIQALKTKKQQQRQSNKRTFRTRLQPIEDDVSLPKLVDDNPSPTNYDMTILHLDVDEENDDEDEENSMFTAKSSTNQKKPIPQWARKNELQIAICNQLYFHRNPSEIFGNAADCSPTNLRTMLHSMLPNVQLIDDDRTISINNQHSILV